MIEIVFNSGRTIRQQYTPANELSKNSDKRLFEMTWLLEAVERTSAAYLGQRCSMKYCFDNNELYVLSFLFYLCFFNLVFLFIFLFFCPQKSGHKNAKMPKCEKILKI